MTNSPNRTSDPSVAVQVAVVGAHLAKQPLNHQLTSRNATLVKATHTAPIYKLFALAGTVPPKPGLVRVDPNLEQGTNIEVEVWAMSEAAFGSFVAEIPSPLGIGTLILEDNETVKGFICEPYGLSNAIDISSYGGWRAYLAKLT
jgi:allophanate hydrolase